MKELIFGAIGGTALLMYGVDMMGDGLEKASGDTMKRILSVLTGNVFMAFLVGIFVTALVQSSTAVTVLTVGFVNSGLLNLSQAVGIIYGANIGTTITAQLMSFSFNFNLTDVALPILGVGFAINSLAKNNKLKDIGQALMGFGMMFLGLRILNSGVPYMEQSVALRNFFAKYATNPVIGITLGAVVTAMVHSSAATIAIIMILSEAGLIGLEAAVYIILGENLGTCITAQLASQNGNTNARRTAWAHTLYNVFGSLLAIIFFPVFMNIVNGFTELIYGAGANISNYLANAHTLFNTINAMIFLPLTGVYVKFLERVIKPREEEVYSSISYLDPLLLDTPSVALETGRMELIRCVEVVKDMLSETMELMVEFDEERMETIAEYEQEVNSIQKELIKYIVKISEKELTENQSIVVPAMIRSISRIERAADRVYEIAQICEKKQREGLVFSEYAIDEILILKQDVQEMADITIEALEGNFENIELIEELEDGVDEKTEEFQRNYMERLHTGTCAVDSGVLFIDIMAHLERMADHMYKTAMYAANELSGEKGNKRKLQIPTPAPTAR